MKSTATVVCARILVWLMVAATLVAVVQGAHWAWMLAALGLALTADMRDLARWPASGRVRRRRA
jgi:hypothetical protein